MVTTNASILFWPNTGAVINVIMIQLKLGSISSCRAKRETFLLVGHLWFYFCFWLKSRTKRLRSSLELCHPLPQSKKCTVIYISHYRYVSVIRENRLESNL